MTKAITCAQSRIMQRIGTKMSIMLHETAILSTLLYGCETWILDAKESSLVERTDLWAIKKLFGLPPTTPTPAVRYFTGTMFTDVIINKRQLIYLQHLLQKENGYWAKGALATQKENDFGWIKNIMRTLEQWGLEQQWEVIASKSKAAWEREVKIAAEKQNRTKLTEACHTKHRGTSKAKTKTKTIVEKLQNDTYKRTPLPLIHGLTTIQTRALIMGRYGMLDCKSNFSMGYGGKKCVECDTDDDETHRINYCPKYCHVNQYGKADKIDFEKVHSDELTEAMTVINAILNVWDLEHGKNTVKRGAN